jgi:predicted ATP-grasp superfamily ATP-dependent carboligase
VAGISWGAYEYGPRSRYLRRRYVIGTNGAAGRDEEVLAAIRDAVGAERGVLFADSDASVDLILRHWDEIHELADVPLPEDRAILTAIRRKDELPAAAAKTGVHAPATVLASSDRAVRAAGLHTPVLVKPVEGKSFELAFDRKAIVADDLEQAVAVARTARERGFETIVQELVPDSEERIYSLFTYIGRSGEPLLSVTGRKLRQFPIRFGSSTVFQLCPEPRALELGLKLLKGLGYRGLAHVEFAHDLRDDGFKLLEVNTRAPIWVSAATGGELDIVRIAYEDLSHRDLPQARVRDEDRV